MMNVLSEVLWEWSLRGMGGADFEWVLLGFTKPDTYVQQWLNPLHPYGKSAIRTSWPDTTVSESLNVKLTPFDLRASETAKLNHGTPVCFRHALVGFDSR
jgi:hypothetical protein